MAKLSGIERIRQFLLANVGRIVTTADLIEASGGASEAPRRMRQLRDEQGWPIQSHHDDATLKPGQYRLVGIPSREKDVRFSRKISGRLRAEVLDRNGFTCQMCGITPSDVDPATSRPARMHVGHIVDKSLGGRDELSNLRTLCSSCNQGAKNITTERPTAVWLLAQVRRAGRDEQRAVFDWLRSKFGGD